jgi:hypothetical protein
MTAVLPARVKFAPILRATICVTNRMALKKSGRYSCRCGLIDMPLAEAQLAIRTSPIVNRSPAEANGENSWSPILRETALPPQSIARKRTKQITLGGIILWLV